MPLVFSKTNASQDLQQLLQTFVELAKEIQIPPIQAVYDPRQLETLFEQTQHTLEEAVSGLQRSQRRQGGIQLHDFGMSEFAIGAELEGGEHPELTEVSTVMGDAVAQTIEQLEAAARGLAVELIHSDPPSLIATCARFKGTLIKSAINLERQHCAHMGTKPTLTHHMDEEGALAVRRAYTSFKRALRPVHADDLTKLEEMIPLMERASQALAALCADASFPRMYYRDRLQSLDLRRRIQLWLEEPTDMAHAEGLRQEVVQMSEGFNGINQRQELKEHDTRQIQELLGRWSNMNENEYLEPEHFDALGALLGRDALLDGWIMERPRISFALLMPALQSVRI